MSGHWLEPARLVAAAPVGADDAVARLLEVADAVTVLASPPSFRSVGDLYVDFRQTTDAEVRALLAR